RLLGGIELRGPGAGTLCQELTVNDVSRLGDGDGQYSILCTEAGGVLDDLVVFRLAEERFLLVVNAANTAADLAWIAARAPGDGGVHDASQETALLALQGPCAERALRTLTAVDLGAMRPFTLREGAVAGVRVLMSRTGYTGEDGFELFVPGTEARTVWDAVLAAVRRSGGLPRGRCGGDTPGRRRAAVRPCGARPAAPRGGLAALRKRHGRGHDTARGRHRLGREAAEEVVRR